MIIILTLSIILIIAYYLNCGQSENSIKHESFNPKIRLDDIKVDETVLIKIRQILKIIDKVFNYYNIMYWADCGTLLGMIRHGDIIPWDDDGDVSILHKDEQKFLYLKPVFEGLGYGVSTWWGGYKIYPLNGEISKESWNGVTYNYNYPFVDVFIVDYDNSGNIVSYVKPGAKKQWPNEYHYTKYLFPLKRYKFNDFSLWGPNSCENYLSRAYGSDWEKVAYLQYDHKNMKHHKKRKFLLSDII